ncbi:MAG: sugar phosphate nucleotidyltransferase, partial [Pseudobdellovibrio sp.]
MNVFMLAAGLGARLRPVTLKYPKPCVPFLNVPLGLYNFRFFESIPVTSLTINTFHIPEKTVSLYESQPFYKGDIHFSHEKNVILGSSGGLKHASSFFLNRSDTILMLNSDEVLFDVDPSFLNQAYEQHLKEKNLATLVVMKHPEAGKKFGAIWCEGPRVVHIG